MDRTIQTTGSAWFMTRPATYPVEITITSDRQATNAERMRLSRAMDALLTKAVDAGIDVERMRQPPGGDPMQYLRNPTDLAASTIVDCSKPTELSQLHGIATRADQGDDAVAYTDLPPVHAENPADRASAMAKATDAATAAAVAIANQVGVTLGELVGATEIDAGAATEDSAGARRVPVRVRAAFSIG